MPVLFLMRVLFLLAMLPGESLAVPTGTPRPTPPRGGTLTIGLSYDLETLNVYATGFLGNVEASVVEGLVAPDEQARYVPVLATAVPIIRNGGIALGSAGGMTVTYSSATGRQMAGRRMCCLSLRATAPTPRCRTRR